MNKSEFNFFSDSIIEWSECNDFDHPWKNTKDPYMIWLSEIILQQTKVIQGKKYYNSFITRFPYLKDLANAEEDEVLKLWEGLGYYTRARNLHFTAKYILNELKGKFPNTYDEILQLKGVGPYTASAISSFAFDIPKAVVDGNVLRVISRFFGLKNSYSTSAEIREMNVLANSLLPKDRHAKYNQGIMDFGANLCTPKNYQCEICFLRTACFAHNNDMQNDLPVKKKKIAIKERFFTFLVIHYEGGLLIEQRKSKDIWNSLFQFPLLESNDKFPKSEQIDNFMETLNFKDGHFNMTDNSYLHKLTHQKLHCRFIEVKLGSAINTDFIKVGIENLYKFAFPKIINVYLKEKNYI